MQLKNEIIALFEEKMKLRYFIYLYNELVYINTYFNTELRIKFYHKLIFVYLFN